MNDIAKFGSEIGMDFDKDDVVTVAIAKIDISIRKEIRTAKADVTAFDKEIETLQKEFHNQAEKARPKAVTANLETFKKAVGSAKMNDSMKVELNSSCSLYEGAMNTHIVIMKRLDEYGQPSGSNFEIFRVLNVLTARQNAILKNIESLKNKKSIRVQDGIDWKRRLQDMPAAERQMKAVVVENELNKSQAGKDLVALLEKRYSTTIKEIEM